jgi:hypothetical protein
MMLALLMATEIGLIGPRLPAVPTAVVVGKCRKSNDEIVVCGQSEQEIYRLRTRLPDEPPLLPKAEIAIGDTKLAVENQAASIGGIPVNRMMVRMKLKF